eukprot:m.319057 g.319057  ORF g.319057 m.319057 type:complete len:174 (-) comp16445_c0_seq70:3004-3525(-)
MSDALAGFALEHDPARQVRIWVDDFTPAEAAQVLDAHGFMNTSDKWPRRNETIRKIGTRPADLDALLSAVHYDQTATVELFEQNVIDEALNVLRSLLTPTAESNNPFVWLARKLHRTTEKETCTAVLACPGKTLSKISHASPMWPQSSRRTTLSCTIRRATSTDSSRMLSAGL